MGSADAGGDGLASVKHIATGGWIGRGPCAEREVAPSLAHATTSYAMATRVDTQFYQDARDALLKALVE